MSAIRTWLVLLIVSLATLLSRTAFAHGQRIAYLEIAELGSGRASAGLRLSVPEPSLEFEIRSCNVEPTSSNPTALARSFSIDCANAPLSGRVIEFTGLGSVVDEAVVHVRFADGSEASSLLRPAAPAWTLPGGSVSSWDVFPRYVCLGLEHI